MRLIPQKSREYNGKSYYKFLIVVPSKIIEKLGWKGGEELTAEAHNDTLTIKQETKAKVQLIKTKN